jgi:ATP-dependent RNA helicase UAP56/SUB2
VRLGKYLPSITSEVIFGGIPIEKDKEKMKKNPIILISTPGRILDLYSRQQIKFEKLRFFVLDEADKVLEKASMVKDIVSVFVKTPVDKQVLMFSATMPAETKKTALKFVQEHEEITIDEPHKLILEGILQHFVKLTEGQKLKKLIDLMDNLVFNQIVIFTAKVERAIELNKILKENGFPSITLHSKLKAEERIQKYKEFKEGTSKILVTTDICARGVDMEKVNIVFNYDLPLPATNDAQVDTYLHRVGRTARFGTKGLAISFIASPEDEATLAKIQERFVLKITELPETINTDNYMNQA